MRLQSETLRSYGLVNRQQGRILVSGKRRRRLVHIGQRSPITRFEILGLDDDPLISELRLVPQPWWRVRRLLAAKLLRLHPAYRKETLKQRSFAQQWRDYNQLLSRQNFALVGYDEWIERVEVPALEEQARRNQFASTEAAANPTSVNFAIWLWGQRDNEQQCQGSIDSVRNQTPGPFQILPPEQQLLDEDQYTWIVFLQAGDQLAPQALAHCSAVIQARPDAGVLYADEDKVSPMGRRHSPQFKPAWNPDLLYSDPHYSHCWLIRADLCIKACEAISADGETPDLYGIALEATARCEGDQILHLPEVLYHRLDQPGELRSSRQTAESLQKFHARHGRNVQVSHHQTGGHLLHWPLPEPPPLVSVIIATRDRGDLLRCCLTSLAEHGQGNPPTELIVIDNGSSEPETLHYLAHLEQQENVRVLRRPGKFNYAALNNEAVTLARGELIALMNNDVEATHSGWLAAMAGQAVRPEIGAVGAKLLFPDGTIQHAGVLLGIGGIAGHAHKYLAADDEGYQLRLHLAHNLSAVTAATLVVRKALFEAVGGFDAINFAVNYNDVDFCLRLIKAGYRNLYCPDAVLIHHESKSRGAPTEADTHAQWQRERQAMIDRWGAALEADPHYSPHLSLLEENLSLTLKASTSTARTSALPSS
ncbi:MAG: glycosyltransferase family 2 protein [Cyanobacteria bacterium]|nr:glycosyltransferase family 2 protein [Cyanobacteriota bacterium]